MRRVRAVQRVATPGRVLGTFAAWLAFSAWFFAAGPYAGMEAHGGIPDERGGAGPDGHLRHIRSMGEEGRADYRTFLLWDLLFPLLLAASLAGLLALAARRVRWLPEWGVVVPVVALLADWLENAAFLTLLAQHPDMSRALAVAAVVFQWLKFLALGAVVVLLMAVLVHFVMNPVRRRPAARGRTRDRDRRRER